MHIYHHSAAICYDDEDDDDDDHSDGDDGMPSHSARWKHYLFHQVQQINNDVGDVSFVFIFSTIPFTYRCLPFKCYFHFTFV